MADVAIVPRAMLAKKPKHGAACNRCGLCCHAILCDVAQSIHRRRQGPCPELKWDADGSRCGLIDRSEGEMREAALLLINTGQGCDMKLRSEPRDRAYTARQDARDRKNRHILEKARRLWGLLWMERKMSWRWEMEDNGKWISNGVRFATKEEAERYGFDLGMRWIGMPEPARATLSDEPVNYAWTDKGLVSVGEKVTGL